MDFQAPSPTEVHPDIAAQYVRDREVAEKAREEISYEKIAACGIEPIGIDLATSWPGFQTSTNVKVPPALRTHKYLSACQNKPDMIATLAQSPELIMEVTKYLDVQSLVKIYSISKDFNEIINGHLAHVMMTCALTQAPESARIFAFTLYEPLCVVDPAGRTGLCPSSNIRKVPGLRWLQMVIHREKTVRDILACLARQGHRTPKGMALTLKKVWLLMDISTTIRRVQLMRSQTYFTNEDLYNLQLFIVKLDMRFNDPIEGPGSDLLRKLMLGQRGLTPLCKLLKRTAYTSNVEIIKAAVRYSCEVRPQDRHLPILGIPPAEIGIGHLEGWGAGRIHLMRPDELVVDESVRRRLNFKDHILLMMLWGYVDPITGQNIQVTDEEKYMSDEEA
ncbi:hypothetical protein F5884DRAFT_463919 [Xylogone sp. PMI_703]|nr:hypothetical protein F5884DRAFT_463919 [Xylogone sp. PMI_703]